MTPSQRRLLWRCRRGTKELDTLLSAFVRQADLPAAEQRLLARLLDAPDPQLSEWLCGNTPPPDRELASLVRRILAAAER